MQRSDAWDVTRLSPESMTRPDIEVITVADEAAMQVEALAAGAAWSLWCTSARRSTGDRYAATELTPV